MKISTKEYNKTHPHSAILVSAPSRVHLSLLQMSSHFKTINMGIGMSLEVPRWLILARKNAKRDIFSKNSGLIIHDEFYQEANILFSNLSKVIETSPIEVTIIEKIPSHVGLGSKTSFLCALVAAKCSLAGLERIWPEYRHITRRGGTSGIGINVASTGGFILDSGHSEESIKRIMGPSSARSGRKPPKIAARWEMPLWEFLLAIPKNVPRIWGDEEKRFFDKVLPIPKNEVEKVAGIILYDVIPAISSKDRKNLALGISKLQEIGFKLREWQYQSSEVHLIKNTSLSYGADCVALSSVGPSLLIMGNKLSEVKEALEKLRIEGLELIYTRPINIGITVKYVN